MLDDALGFYYELLKLKRNSDYPQKVMIFEKLSYLKNGNFV
jgi:hypothetical protein